MKLEGITILIINTGEVITENQNSIEILETEKKHLVYSIGTADGRGIKNILNSTAKARRCRDELS